MRYTVNANTFMQLPYTTGTVQNISNTDIEISNEQVIGTGIILKAGETFAFDNATIYACARPVLDGGTGIISVVPFNAGGRGGESPIYVPKGSVSFASLPSTLNSTMLGWTYNVSDAFTTDNRFVEGSGIDYPAGENVVVVEPSTGVFKYDCFGGAYILPTASTTVKGGIKIGTGVEVDANQKLNVTAATSSVIGGVKSSTTDGDVTVNNDGTMTINPVGYRKASTAYEVGDIAYHSALPTGYYLECTTAGTSGSSALTISTTTLGTTVSDGTLTWEINRNLGLDGGTINGDLTVTGTINGISSSAGFLPITGGALQGTDSVISRAVNNSTLNIRGGLKNGNTNISARLGLYGGTYPTETYAGNFILEAATEDTNIKLIGKPNGELTWNSNDLAGSSIVAKSLGTNGYVKYASGLIIQWGRVIITGGSGEGSYNINFTQNPTIAATNYGEVTGRTYAVGNISTSKFNVYCSATGSITFFWIAIGY